MPSPGFISFFTRFSTTPRLSAWIALMGLLSQGADRKRTSHGPHLALNTRRPFRPTVSQSRKAFMADRSQIADILEDKAARSSCEHHVRFDSACAWAQPASQPAGRLQAIDIGHRARDLLSFITDFSDAFLQFTLPSHPAEMRLEPPRHGARCCPPSAGPSDGGMIHGRGSQENSLHRG